MFSLSNYNLTRYFFLVCLLLGITDYCPAQPPDSPFDSGLGGGNSIIGSVYLPSGQKPGTRMRVRLFTLTRGDVTSMTDDNGKFSFRGLVGGNYTVVIDDEKEFEPFSQQVDIIQLRGAPPQAVSLNIRLTVKGRTGFKPGVVNAELANVPPRALDFYKKAVDLAKSGDPKSAIEQLQLATSEYPKFMLAFNEMGVQHVRLNECEKAEESFRSALKIEPEAYSPLINHGIVLVLLSRYVEAEPVLRKALKLNEKSPVGHYYLGRAVANLGRFDEAEKELVSSVKLGGDEIKEAHRYLAIIYSSRGDMKRNLIELETYIRLVPTAPDAEQLRNVILQLKGSDKAIPVSTPKPSS